MAYVNRYGRKGGRGVRPVLLMIKLVGVMAWFGALLATTVFCFVAAPTTRDDWAEMLDVIHVNMVYVGVPGLIVALVAGALLLWHHGMVLWRMRWLKTKLAILAVAIPVLHLSLSSLLRSIRADLLYMEPDGPGGRWELFRIGLIVAIVVFLAVIMLGRIKPRLGQNYARTFRGETAKETR